MSVHVVESVVDHIPAQALSGMPVPAFSVGDRALVSRLVGDYAPGRVSRIIRTSRYVVTPDGSSSLLQWSADIEVTLPDGRKRTFPAAWVHNLTSED